MDMIADQSDLPHPDLANAWAAIKLPATVRERLLAQSVLALHLTVCLGDGMVRGGSYTNSQTPR